MISFDAGDWRFHLRAAAVIRDGDRVLLHRMERDAFWALPGGRVEIGEPAEQAVRRELREELDTEVQVGQLLWVVENLYLYRERPQHGVELHFLVRLPEGSPLLQRESFERGEWGVGLNGGPASAVRLLFRWFTTQELAGLDLRPALLREALAAPPEAGVRHFVQNDLR